MEATPNKMLMSVVEEGARATRAKNFDGELKPAATLREKAEKPVSQVVREPDPESLADTLPPHLRDGVFGETIR